PFLQEIRHAVYCLHAHADLVFIRACQKYQQWKYTVRQNFSNKMETHKVQKITFTSHEKGAVS
ncbi:hypothetical protein CVV73_25810, partial [Enterobacter hormaechei]